MRSSLGAGQDSSDARIELARLLAAVPSPLNGERARERGGVVRTRLLTHIYSLSRFPLNSDARRILSHTRPCHPYGSRPMPFGHLPIQNCLKLESTTSPFSVFPTIPPTPLTPIPT